jgi:hypothetical protein
MTKRDVLSIAFKIMGVSFIYTAITTFPQMGIFISSYGRGDSSLYSNIFIIIGFILYPLWLLGFAYVFFRFGDSMAELLLPADAELPPMDINQQHKPIFSLALRIFGVLCLTRGIPEIASFLTRLFQFQYERLSPYDFANGISGVVLLVLGGYLITGGKWLVDFAFKEKPRKPIEPEASIE